MVPLPLVLESVPLGQSVHTERPVVLPYVPTEQLEHMVAPLADANVPYEQLVHAVPAEAVLYDPMAHALEMEA